MNADDFEKQLKRQALRQVPSEWREDILRAAEAAGRNPTLENRDASWLSTLISQHSTLK